MKNLHLHHIEDLLFLKADPYEPLKYIEALTRFVNGEKDPNTFVSVKWDGSPAFVCGEHPDDGRFFIGTKSAFSGKTCSTYNEISENYGDNPELNDILGILFSHLCDLDWKTVVQGDLLWTPQSKDKEYNYKDSYFSFQPNCIRYHFPMYQNATIGAVIHTTYNGVDTFDNLEASFGATIPYHTPNYPPICLFEPSLSVPKKSLFGNNMVMRFDWEGRIKDLINDSYIMAKIISQFETLKLFQEPKLLDNFCKFVNGTIKSGYINLQYMEFIRYLDSAYRKHASELKTQKGSDKVLAELKDYLQRIDAYELDVIFHYYNNLVLTKSYLNTMLNETYPFVYPNNCLKSLPDGEQCGHEGYVVSLGGNKAVKFVDRHIFSKANFDMVRK